MLKKIVEKFVLISLIILGSSGLLYASLGERSLHEIAKDSDIIIEGFVQDQSNATTQYGGFKFFKLSHVKVEKVYKGEMTAEQVIDIYSHSDFFYDTSVLESNKHYFLLLKKHGAGYVDAFFGQGEWIIEQDGNGRRIKSSIHEQTFSYDDFIRKLAEAINQQDPAKEKIFRWF